MTKKTKINRSDLTFYPSERLTDNPDGGGQPLGQPIAGRANELFDPISSVARVNGDFNAVLLYAGVRRDDSEPLLGANVAITKPPADDSVSYLLAKAEFGELRKNAIKRIEGYVAPTIESKMTLLSSPTKGSKIIQVYQRQGESLPQIGDNYCLSQEKQGYPALRQFVSVVKVEATDRTFNDGQHDFVRTVIKLEISQPLLHDFVGVDYPSPRLADSPTKVRETHVADSASYYGVKPLVKAITKGSASLQVSSLNEKLIPNGQSDPQNQPNPSGQPNPNGQTNPQGSPNPNGQANPNGQPNPNTPTPPNGGGQTPFELPAFCDWAKPVCDFIKWFKDKPPDEEPPQQLPKVTLEELGLGEKTKSRLNFNGACPQKTLEFSFNGYHLVQPIPMHHYCRFLETLAPFLVGFTWLSCAIMIIRSL